MSTLKIPMYRIKIKKMNTIKTLVGAFLIASSLLTSCGENKSEEKTKVNTKEISGNKKDTENLDDANKVKEEEIIPANLIVKLFFQSDDIIEEDGTEFKGTVDERIEFRTKKAYTYCYDAEGFDNLQLIGKGKHIFLEIKDQNKIIYSKKDFEVKDKLVFSIKDFDFGMGTTYSVILKQKETVLFSGKIDSQGCR